MVSAFSSPHPWVTLFIQDTFLDLVITILAYRWWAIPFVRESDWWWLLYHPRHRVLAALVLTFALRLVIMTIVLWRMP